VVVFKTPSLDQGASVGPGGVSPPGAYQDNFIKRLVGKPNETIMILDGDIYVATTEKQLADLKPDDFTIQTKSWDVQEALWRIVYDNDHQPTGKSRTYVSPTTKQIEWTDPAWRQPWTPVGANGWTTLGRTFEFDSSKGDGTIKFDTSAIPTTFPLTDWLAYDITGEVGSPRRPNDQFRPRDNDNDYEYPMRANNVWPVSDLKLAMTYRRFEGEGKLRLNIQKRDQTAIVELDASSYAIKRTIGGNETTIVSGSRSGIGSGDGSRVEFTFVDHQATLRIDGKIVAQSKPGDFPTNVSALLAEFESNQPPSIGSVWIEAAGHRAAFRHLSLWRDIHYINRAGRWGIPKKFPTGTGNVQLIRLGKGEYFVLGDNSLLSLDARMWDDPINLPDEALHVESGRVPERFLIGKAFFVYWPSGFPVSGPSLRLVPNFGEMRVIE
ncbi:MAG TPA: S26 family signal peptidase, partial [Tepidisphaeraceae bacterium]|nr:S26 family signal peptidase [Tepidisphaeraceae bacterium]